MKQRKKAADFPQEILKLFDGYVHDFHTDTTPRPDDERRNRVA